MKMVVLGALLLCGGPVSAQRMVLVSKPGNAALVCEADWYERLPHPSIWSLSPLRRRCALQGDSRQWAQWGVAFSHDGRLLAFACKDDRTIEIFDARTGKLRIRLCHVPDYPYTHVTGSVAFSPDGRTLAVGTAQRLFLWNWRRKKLLSTSRIRYRVEIEETLQGSPEELTPGSLQFSPDGRTLAFQGGSLMPVFLFDVAHKRVQRVLPIHCEDGYALALRFSPDGRRLLVTSFWHVSASFYDQVHLFDANTGRLIWRRDNDYDYRMDAFHYRLAAFSADGRSVGFAGDRNLEVRDARDGRLKFARECKVYGPQPYFRLLPPLALQKRMLPELTLH